MATRFYLPSSGTSPLAALALASGKWDSSGATFFRAPTAITKTQNSALTNFANTFPSTATQQMCYAQWVSPQIEAHEFTIAETYAWVIRNVEGNAAVDATTAYNIRVVSGDGVSLRGTLISTYAGGEFATTAATNAATAVFTANVSAQYGDRIVIEMGARGLTPSIDYTATMRFGDPSATADFALTSGLTTDLCPWVELSPTLTFLSAGGSKFWWLNA